MADPIDPSSKPPGRALSRRGVIAAVVLLLWLAGFAALAARELFQSQADELAHAGRLVEPGAEFYTVMQAGQQIGFMSATADTVADGIKLGELFVTERSVGHALRRKEVRTTVRLTRALELRGFTRQFGSDTAALVITGAVQGDSAVTITTRAGSAAPRVVKSVPITTPLLLPMEVPLAIALGGTPKIGQSYRYTVFDPVRMASGEATLRVMAESLFVLSDSAAFDSAAGRWVSAHDTTVRAWRIEEPSGGSLNAWIDGSGHVVQAQRPGLLTLRRTAYELAFENWSAASKRQRRDVAADVLARPTAARTAAATEPPTAHTAANRP